jgi:hypothetical protein
MQLDVTRNITQSSPSHLIERICGRLLTHYVQTMQIHTGGNLQLFLKLTSLVSTTEVIYFRRKNGMTAHSEE